MLTNRRCNYLFTDMKTNVKDYTDLEILDRVKSLPSCIKTKALPQYLVVGIRSNEDEPNKFDDKIYLFINGQFCLVTSCTTNAGTPSLLGGYKKYNSKGAAVIKSDEIYYDAFQKSDGKKVPHHSGKMQCLRQIKSIKYYRDGNNNSKIDEVGEIELANNSTNIHFNNYDLTTKLIGQVIGGWSAGCQVLNIGEDYNKLLELIPYEIKVTYALLKEF